MGMGLSLQDDLSFVGGMNSGKYLDQCALAAAVLARQAVNFTREDGEVDVGQGANPAETFADAAHFDERRFAFRCGEGACLLRLRALRCVGHGFALVAPDSYLFSVIYHSCSSSSSSFVLGRFSGGRSENPAACFLHSSFFRPGKPPRSPTEDEGRGGLGHPAWKGPCTPAIAHNPIAANCATVSLLIGWSLITRITLFCGSTVALPKPGKSIPSTIGVPSIISFARLTIAFPASTGFQM